MADGDQNPTATLGRVMSWIGYLWAIFAVLWGLGAVEALGISGPMASGLGSTIFPAIILIGVGRVLRKRARVDEDVILPDVSPRPVPTPPILPGNKPLSSYPPPVIPPTSKPPPRPAPPPQQPGGRRVEVGTDSEPHDEPTPAVDAGVPSPTHKTSQELIDEARQRWGTRP